MSADVFIDFGSFFAHPTARVGRNVTIGAYCILGTVTIGDDVLVGSRVSIPSGKYQHGSSMIRAEEVEEIQYDRIIIGDRSWIGEGAIIMANVGSDVIIGGGSVVTRSIPENRVALGNPARPVVKRKEN
jgi:acetyltransferase-like isoleucine patch superfamily enzyme